MNLYEQKWKTFIKNELGQPSGLPEKAREQVQAYGEILLYGLSDLNEDFQICQTWIIVTETHVCLYHEKEEFTALSLAQIHRVVELDSLSSTTLLLKQMDDSPALAKFSFSHRQKGTMGQIKYMIEALIEEDQTDKEALLQNLKGDADHNYLATVIKPIEETQNSIAENDSTTLWRLLGYLRPYKKELAVGIVGAVAATGFGLIPAYLSGRMIDKIIRPFQDGKVDFQEAKWMGIAAISALAVTYLIREFFIFLRLKKMSILGEYVARDLREELYSHLQTLGLDFYSKKQTGSIISRVSSDTDRIWDFIAFGVVETAIAILTLTGLSIVLIAMDWRLGLIMTIPVPLFLAAVYFHGEKMKKLFLKAWRKWSDVTAVLSDTIPGIQVVKAFNQESREKKRFNKRNEAVMEEFNNIHKSWTVFWPFLMLGIQATLVTVWAMGMPRLLSDAEQPTHLTAGTFVSFLLYMTMFAQPIEVIGQVARMLNRALSSAYRIFEVLDTRPTIKKEREALTPGPLRGEVQFKNIHFSYDGVRKIIRNLSFHVKPGEMIGLVGESGGGKSTLTKLLVRFFEVDSGHILVDGKDIRHLELGAYRRQVGMVLQDPYLFHGTIWENIAYGIENASKEEVVAAARKAHAHEFICRLPFGYDTVVGERGHTLSGGERQRVSIARAILSNPKILILDEATSAVDTETERKIQDALDELVKGKTVFAIAHRLSTLRKANRIFVIKKGQIVEAGDHTELLSKPTGEYRKLYQMQQQMADSFAL